MSLALITPSPATFLAAAFVLLLAIASLAVIRSQLFALALLLALFIPTYAMRDQLDISTHLGTVRVTALDGLSALLFVLGIFRTITGRRRAGVLGATLFLVLLVVLHFARGAAAFGLQTATNSSRPWFYFVSCLVFAATAPKPWGRRAWVLVIGAGLALAVIAIPYLAVEGFHSTTRRILVDGEFVDSRPIVAGGALLVLQALILIFALQWPSSKRVQYPAGLAGIGVIVLQHRTVWAAAAITGIVGFAMWAKRKDKVARPEVLGVTGLGVLLLPFALWGLAQSTTLRVSAGETTSKQSTFQWRIDSWVELISKHHSATDLFIGEPAGTSWARSVFGEQTNVAAHSSYVEAFLRLGIGGAVAFVLLLILLARSRATIGRVTGLTATGVTLLLITQALFAVTYTLSIVEGLILGIFVSALASEPVPQEALEVTGPRGQRSYAVAESL
jgi:hypothetical protein